MQQQKNNPEEHDVEVLPMGTRPPSDDGGRAVQRGRQNIIIGTLNVIADPARGAFIEPIERRYFRHYQPSRPHGKWHLIVDAFLFLAVVALVGYNVALYVGYGRSLLPGVQMEIVRSSTLVSGQPATYTITYINNNKARLHDASIALRVPISLQDIIVEPTDGFNTKTKTWKLGTIDAGVTTTLTVRGNVLGALQETITLGASLTFTPEDGRRSEYLLATDQGVIVGAPLAITVQAPERVINHETVTVTVQYKNTGIFSLKRVELQPIFPEGFVVERAEPALKKGVMSIGTLAPDGEGIITVTGTLDGRGQEQVVFAVRTTIQEAARSIDQGETTVTVTVFYPKFRAGLAIDMPSIHPGEATTYTVTYTNDETVDVLDAAIDIEFPKAFLQDGTFVSDYGTQEGTIIRFTKKKVPALALVKPKGTGMLLFTVATRATLDQRILFPSGKTILAIPVTATYRMEPQVDVRILNKTAIDLSVGAALELQSFARYYTAEGEQLGRGPLPPVAGKTTRYWILWNVANAVNEVHAVVVRGVLPAGVAWTGRTSTTYGDAVKFDTVTNTVLWNIDIVKRETGGIYPDVGASFEVALTPDATQIGKTVPLLIEQVIQGQDSVTKETIEREAPATTSALLYDPQAKGKGSVRAP